MADLLPLMGYVPNRAGTDDFLSSLSHPTLAQAGPNLTLDETKDVFLGSYLLTLFPQWKRGAQTIGSCTGWAGAHCSDILAVCDIAVRGEMEGYGGDTIQASVYGFARTLNGPNYGGDGCYGGAIAKALTTKGTLHFGQDYNGKTFTTPSGSLERDWGRSGVPAEFLPFANEHRVNSTTLVKDFEAAARCIQNGLPVMVCSNQGFSMTLRDGYLSPMGHWSHAMSFTGVRWKPYPALWCENSWGDCYSGTPDPNVPKPFQFSGGWVKAATATSMLAGEDSFAYAGFQGFEPRRLPDWTGRVL